MSFRRVVARNAGRRRAAAVALRRNGATATTTSAPFSLTSDVGALQQQARGYGDGRGNTNHSSMMISGSRIENELAQVNRAGGAIGRRASKGTWGHHSENRLSSERLLEAAVRGVSGDHRIHRLRMMMRSDPRPWNVFYRLDKSRFLLKDFECAQLLLWTAAIVNLESDQGRKVHAIHMGHEMFAAMNRTHRTAIETLNAFYRLCEVSRDLTTAFRFFSSHVVKHYPPLMENTTRGAENGAAPSANNNDGRKKLKRKRIGGAPIIMSGAAGNPNTEGGGVSAPADAPFSDEAEGVQDGDKIFKRRYTADVLLHLVWLLRITAAQPNDDKCEEIAQIIRTLYEHQGFARFGALPVEPRSEAHRDRLIRKMCGGAAASSSSPQQHGGAGAVDMNGAITPEIAKQSSASLFLGGISASTHRQHKEVFALLHHMRPRIELCAKLDAEADGTILSWIEEYCEALSIVKSPPTAATTRSGGGGLGSSSASSSSASSSSPPSVISIQTGRWLINPNSAAQQRVPQMNMYFPHLDGGLQMAANVASTVAEGAGISTALNAAGSGGGAAVATSSSSSSSKSLAGGEGSAAQQESLVVLAPPSWDRPYLRDSLLRDDIIEQLEALAFSFASSSFVTDSSNKKDRGSANDEETAALLFKSGIAEESFYGNQQQQRPLSVVNPQLARLIETQPPAKRFALLTDLVSRLKGEIASLSESYAEWVEKQTGAALDADADHDGKRGDRFYASQQLTRKTIEDKTLAAKFANGGSPRLQDRDQEAKRKLLVSTISKSPIPSEVSASSVWRCVSNTMRKGTPTLFGEGMEEEVERVYRASPSSWTVPLLDATSVVQNGPQQRKYEAHRHSDKSKANGGAVTSVVVSDTNLNLFTNSVNAYGKMTAELYHYLLVALSSYAVSSANSLLRKLKEADIQLLDVTRGSVIATFVQDAIRTQRAQHNNAGEAEAATGGSGSDVTLSLSGPPAATPITDRLSEAFNESHSTIAVAVSLFKEQLEAIRYRANLDRDNDVTRATQAYWSYNYPLLLEYRNAFADVGSFYSYLLPAIGVNGLLDLVLASEVHKKIVVGNNNSNGDGGDASSFAVELLPEETLKDVRAMLPIVDAALGAAVGKYLNSVASGQHPLLENDVVFRRETSSSSHNPVGIVDHVLNLITTQLPRLDIALMGAIPHFEGYALPKLADTNAKKSGDGDNGNSVFASQQESEIATSLGELKERIDATHRGAAANAVTTDGHPLPRIQPLYLLDASFLENRDHVSTLLSIISSHRKSSANRQKEKSGAPTTSPPILLAPFSSLSDLATTASGAGRSLFLDASTVLDGTLSAEELEARMEAQYRGQGRKGFTGNGDEDDVARSGVGGATAVVSKFDGPSTEMQSALDALSGVSKLIAKVPKNVMVLHFTEMCLAYHTMEGAAPAAGSGSASAVIAENSDTQLLRMAALLSSLGGSGSSSAVRYHVHLCTDDPAFVLRVRNEPALRQLSHNVHFLSTSPLVSGLLTKEQEEHNRNSSSQRAGDDGVEVVERPAFYAVTGAEEEAAAAGEADSKGTAMKPSSVSDAAAASSSILKAEHSSLWGEDRKDLLESIPLFEGISALGNGRLQGDGDDDDAFAFNLAEDRPINPVSAEELEAEAKRNYAALEALKSSAVPSASPSPSSSSVSEATSIGEFSADSWMDMLSEEDDTAPMAAAVSADAAQTQAPPATATAAATDTNNEADDADGMDDLLANWASADDKRELFQSASDASSSSMSAAPSSMKHPPQQQKPSSSASSHMVLAKQRFNAAEVDIAPQDIIPKSVKILGDTSRLKEDADEILNQLITSGDEEAVALAKSFLLRREQQQVLTDEMSLNSNLSSKVHDIQGSDDGAVFFGQFDTTRTAAKAEMLTLEQQNHLRLQKAMQRGGVRLLKKVLAKIERENISDHSTGAAGGENKMFDINDFANRTAMAKGRGSGVAFNEGEDAALERDDIRRIKHHTEEWSNNPLKQDHLANRKLSQRQQVEHRQGMRRFMRANIDPQQYTVYEANVNDPRNKHLVEAYTSKQNRVVGKRAAKALSPEERYARNRIPNENDGL